MGGNDVWGKYRQQPSQMPVGRYVPFRAHADTNGLAVDRFDDRSWPWKKIGVAPRWCSVDLRDGNQALVDPMSPERKLVLFELLVGLGYKEIEVGFPAASKTDYDFVRLLIEQGRIPDDVVIQVLTQAREDLIAKTCEAVRGASSVIIHVYNSTSKLQRDVVFAMGRDDIVDIAVRGARWCRQYSVPLTEAGADVFFEYSPESFTGTELDFAVRVCDAVVDVWDPSPERKVIINLPATVEMSTPNVFADQVEWFGRHVARRDSIVLSVHPHNDRGTAVAAAELAMMAGAQRVEGCLFGNGERTGNVCLVTLGLNLFTQGVDPMIDFSDVDHIRRTVQECNQMDVHERHPYGGDFVYTAFSGSHQDAINKGLLALEVSARDSSVEVSEHVWEVPYLPVDPKDVGRTYDEVIRVNSQSGKGGVAWMMRTEHSFLLPRRLQIEFSKAIQRETEGTGEIGAERMFALFCDEYFLGSPSVSATYTLVNHTVRTHDTVGAPGTTVEVEVGAGSSPTGRTSVWRGAGNGPLDAFCAGISEQLGSQVEVLDYSEHALSSGGDAEAACYVECDIDGTVLWGVGVDSSIVTASFKAVLSALNRERRTR